MGILILSSIILLSSIPFEAQATDLGVKLVPYSLINMKQSNQLSYNVTEAAVDLTVYVVPAITDTKILPRTFIPSTYISDTISARISPGEYKAASFVVNSDKDIASLQVVASDLSGNGNTISNSTIDIKVVKCWYRGI
jgi:hypothetical protein